MKKTITSILLTLIMLLGMTPFSALPAFAEEQYPIVIDGDYAGLGPTYSDMTFDMTGKNVSHVFEIRGEGHITFENVTFINVSGTDDGSCIYIDGSDLMIYFNNCRFINCSASNDGGAIYINNISGREYSKVHFYDCYAMNCSAGGNGGFMCINDADARVDGSNNIITGCSASKNGGAIYMEYGDTLSDFILADNTAYGGDGGGICNLSNGATISDCRFYRNTCSNAGGGIYTDYATINNCKFFDDNGHSIFTNSGSTEINDCTFKSAYGGGAVNKGTQSNCTFLSTYDYALSTGDGTKDNPYVIKSIDDWDALHYMALKRQRIVYSDGTTKVFGDEYCLYGKYFRLDADISVLNTIGEAQYNKGTGLVDVTYNAFSEFNGNFDGNGHTITYMSSSNAGEKAAFGYANSATVKNLTVDGYIRGSWSLGGIFGAAYNCTAENCTNNAEIHNIAPYTGGIAGYSAYTSFINCTNNGKIDGSERQVGGITGYSDGGTFNCCINNGEVFTGYQKCGGIVGNVTGNVKVLNCINNASVKAMYDYAGGLIGYESNAITAGNCIVNGAVTAASSADGITGFSATGSDYEQCFYNKDKAAGSSHGIGISDNAMKGIAEDEGVGKMPELINDYIDGNNKYPDGWKIAYIDSNTAYPTFGIQYLDKNGDFCVIRDYKHITSDTAELTNGSYIVRGNTSVNRRLQVLGDVLLILVDGSHLTVNGGIRLEDGNTLSIASQSLDGNMGKLTSIATKMGCAGIGGDISSAASSSMNYRGYNCGTLNVFGGNIYAEGCSGETKPSGIKSGAGIGGGSSTAEHQVNKEGLISGGGNGGSVNVYNGSVFAVAHGEAAAIGGASGGFYHTAIATEPTAAFGGNGGNLSIYNGSVTAQADIAAIGVGMGSAHKSVGGMEYRYGEKGTVYQFQGYDYYYRVGNNINSLGEFSKIDDKGGFHPDNHALQILTHKKHIYDAEYTWNGARSECTAKQICSLCPEGTEGHIGKTETTSNITASETTLSCTQDESKTYTAHFTDADIPDDTITDILTACPGHDCTYTSNFNEATGEYIVTEKCKNCSHEKTYTHTFAENEVYEYVQATGNAFIDTGYRPARDTDVQMDVKVNGNYEYWFGVWDNNYNDKAFAFGNDGGGVYVGYYSAGGTDGNGAVSTGIHTVEMNGNIALVDGIARTTYTFDKNAQRLNNTLYLFAQNRSGSFCLPADGQTVTCYGCRIYEKGALVRYYIPVITGGKAGLYDLVENKFYSNRNTTGTIAAGNEEIITVSAKAATCTENGHNVYYQKASKYYTNEACTNEITNLETWLSTIVANGGGMIPASGHKWIEAVQNEAGASTLKTSAGCLSDAVYYKVCSVCDTVSTSETWTKSGTATGHSCENTASYDDTDGVYTVTEECQNCDYTNSYTFTPYDYLAAEKGAYINTGYKPTENTHVVMDVYVNGGTEYWFGVWDTDYNRSAFALGNDGGGIYTGYGNQGGTNSMGPLENGYHTVELNKNKVYFDGVHYTGIAHQYASEGFSLQNSLYLFAQNRKGSAVTLGDQNTIHCYGCEIYDGDTLVRKFVPGKKNDETPGLLDLKNGVFYANCGSASMTALNDETIETVNAVPATCTENGHSAYYKRGFKYYTDADCANEITDLSVWLSIPAEEGGGMLPVSGHIDENGDCACDFCGSTKYYAFSEDTKELEPKWQKPVTPITASADTLSLTEGWYLIDGTVTIENRINASGNVHLILANGSELAAKQGIGIAQDSSLTVYAQMLDVSEMGKITIPGAPENSAGIGSGFSSSCGNIVINGGRIEVTSGGHASGIGGGYNSSCGNIVINGGVVNVTGGYDGSGIGSGYYSSCGNIVINGGVVNAIGGHSGAGIGSGYCGTCSDIVINGGIIRATGGEFAAGIGSGYGSNTKCGNINVNGGIIRAIGGPYASGIGSGYGNSAVTVTYKEGVEHKNENGSEWVNLECALGKTATCTETGTKDAYKNLIDKEYYAVFPFTSADLIGDGTALESWRSTSAESGGGMLPKAAHTWECFDDEKHKCSVCEAEEAHTDNGTGTCEHCGYVKNGLTLEINGQTFTVAAKGKDAGNGVIVVALYESKDNPRLLALMGFDASEAVNGTFGTDGYIKAFWMSTTYIPYCPAAFE